MFRFRIDICKYVNKGPVKGCNLSINVSYSRNQIQSCCQVLRIILESDQEWVCILNSSEVKSIDSIFRKFHNQYRIVEYEVNIERSLFILLFFQSFNLTYLWSGENRFRGKRKIKYQGTSVRWIRLRWLQDVYFVRRLFQVFLLV